MNPCTCLYILYEYLCVGNVHIVCVCGYMHMFVITFVYVRRCLTAYSIVCMPIQYSTVITCGHVVLNIICLSINVHLDQLK